ncbi:MAG: hypothetical protein RLZZ373_3102 [Pseudomonadota bacterium]
MPGAGKSTAGRHLANVLGMPFFDADIEIERRLGMSIRAFFEREGEAAFRDIEQEVLADLAHRGGLVLATGGGAVLREANRQVLRDLTTVVYLRASPKSCSAACATTPSARCCRWPIRCANCATSTRPAIRSTARRRSSSSRLAARLCRRWST